MPKPKPPVQTVHCHPNRIIIDSLANMISTKTNVPEDAVKSILIAENNPSDSNASYETIGVNNYESDDEYRLSPKDRRAGFQARTSISEAEAASFLMQVMRLRKEAIPFITDPLMTADKLPNDPKLRVAWGLRSIFFNAELLIEQWPSGTPEDIPPHERKPIKHWKPCHDPDTCTISVDIPECNAEGIWGYFGTTREENIDAPEKADPEKDFIPDTPAIYSWVIARYRKEDRGMKLPRGFNRKLADNCINLFKELTGNPAPLDQRFNKEVFMSLQLIAAWSDYEADLGTNVMNDFIYFVENQKMGQIETMESTIRFAGKDSNGVDFPDAPLHMCGLKQPYDVYLRRLVTYIVDPKFIDEYLNKWFLKHFVDAGRVTYEFHRKWIDSQAAKLVNSADPNIVKIATLLGSDMLPPPEKLYPPEKMKLYKKGFASLIKFFDSEKMKLYKKGVVSIVKKYPYIKNNWVLVKTSLALVSPYQKYRGPDFQAFREAGKLAMELGIGLTQLPTFKAQYDINLRSGDRYNPKDCLTGIE